MSIGFERDPRRGRALLPRLYTGLRLLVCLTVYTAGTSADNDIELFGTASGGGNVQLVLSSVTISIVTAAGDTPVQLSSLLATRINSDPSLQGLGITASATGNQLLSNGLFSDARTTDTGLRLSLAPGRVLASQKISDTAGGFSGALSNEDEFAYSAASLGDLDGDGVNDLAVGASLDDDGGTSRGAVWILFLNADGSVKTQQKISATTGGFNNALEDGDFFGTSVAALGDLDGDGVTDLAVGATGDDDGGFNHGAVWVLFLNSNGTVKAYQKVSETAGGFSGPLADVSQFGFSLAPLQDLNGDSIDDLAVGAFADNDGGSRRGAVWVLFMNTDGSVKAQQKISDTAGGFTGTLDDFDWFGFSLAPLGDQDGDSLADLAVGAILDDDGGADRGAVWLLHLDSDGSVKNHRKISAVEGGFSGALDDLDSFGASVSVLGDLDGDRVTDLAVGAERDDDGGPDRGAVWILLMDSDGGVKSQQKISATSGNFNGVLANGDRFGFSASPLGDLDGDGVVDLAAGAPFDDDGGLDRGAAWILRLDGRVAICGDTVRVGAEQCDDGALIELDGCSSLCTLDSSLQVLGSARGGSVALTVAGVPVSPATLPGQAPVEVAQAIAAAINADVTLIGLDIGARADGNVVYVDGALTNVSSSDAGISLIAGLGIPAPLADGDINLDGVVNSADIVHGYRVLTAAAPALLPAQLSHADLAPLVSGVPTADGQFTLGDLLLIQRKVLDLVSF